jgi:hypothetical protein
VVPRDDDGVDSPGIERLRFYLDPVNHHRPARIEMYMEKPGEEPGLHATSVFTYLTEEEITVELERMGVPSPSPAR